MSSSSSSSSCSSSSSSSSSGSDSDSSSACDNVVELIEELVKDATESFDFEGSELSFHPNNPSCVSDAAIEEALRFDVRKVRAAFKEIVRAFAEEVRGSGLPEKYHAFCWAYLLHTVQGGKQDLAKAVNDFDASGELPEHRELDALDYLRRVHAVWSKFLDSVDNAEAGSDQEKEKPAKKRARNAKAGSDQEKEKPAKKRARKD